jgi:hypothetical protein
MDFYSTYSRLLIDNHITEDDTSFLSNFDPAANVALIKQAKVEAAMVYACCHNGNCYYPTKVGHIHKNIAGKDLFGQMVSLLRKENILPIAYYTVIYHNDSAKSNPAWRRTDFIGRQHMGRYWFSCPNNPEYAAFVKQQLTEVISYDIAGIFIDMTFWPGICFCHECREKYLRETGGEMPIVINWNDPIWVKFQRIREQWIGDFAHQLTAHIKSQKPDLPVTHQFSPVLQGWYRAQSPLIATACDYTSADFYGGKFQQRLGTKVMAAFSKNLPFEFMTSRCVDLSDHTSTKSEAEMLCSAATTLANGGACFFIDAINPDGTLQPEVYRKLGNVNTTLAPYMVTLARHKPTAVADCGLYFSMASHIDERLNNAKLEDIVPKHGISNMEGVDNRQIEELVGASIALNNAHITYKIIPPETELVGLKTLIITDALYMSNKECQRIRKFVSEGGTLIATGKTSLFDLEGNTTGDFALADIFGVSYQNKDSANISFLASNEGELICAKDPAPLVKATTAKVLAKVAQTFFAPNDPVHYASIHSNPPGLVTDYAGMTVNDFGKGKCIYIYSKFLALHQHAQEAFAQQLLNKHAQSKFILATNAPACVEITLLKSTAQNTLLLCFINYQNEMPNIPVQNITAKIQLPDFIKGKNCSAISGRKDIIYTLEDNSILIEIPQLDTIEMFEIR